ncbi:MAG: serine protease [Phycisphaeraceae bacterium]
MDKYSPEQRVNELLELLATKKGQQRLDDTELEDAEMLAGINDGSISIECVTEDDLERIAKRLGQTGLAEALTKHPVSAHPLATSTDGRSVKVRSSQRRLLFKPLALASLAAAAAIALAMGVVVFRSSPHSNGSPAFQIAWDEPWTSYPRQAATEPPDWTLPAGGATTMGGSTPDQRLNWRLATVIVLTQYGLGSGAFISPDGWILTNYHVVASAAQEAAASGQPIVVRIVTAEPVNGRARAREEQLTATVYRTDPVNDLALLKLDALPQGVSQMPWFALSESVVEDEDAYVIGSPGGGAAWLIRGCTVLGIFEFPEDLTEAVAGRDTASQILDRTRTLVIQTDAGISGGDSGGPLVNEAGEIIGLTFGTPTNLQMGATGYHIALDRLRAFVGTLPEQPEGTPFDLWTAGTARAALTPPSAIDVDQDGSADAITYGFVIPSDDGPPQAVAMAAFVSFTGSQRSARDQEQQQVLVPRGLWGRPDGLGFAYELVIMRRADGLVIVGFSDPNTGTVTRMRLDYDSDQQADFEWHLNHTGQWLSRPVSGALLDVESLTTRQRSIINQFYEAAGRSLPGKANPRGPNPEKQPIQGNSGKNKL